MAGTGAADVVDPGAADEIIAMTDPSVGDDEHSSTGELRPPAEIDVVASAGNPRVEAADRGKEAGAHQNTCRRHGEHVANAVVLLLVSLRGLDHVGSDGELVDDQADVLQYVGLVPFDEFGARNAGIGAQRFGDEHTHGVGGQGHVVVTHEQERRFDVGLEDGIGRCGESVRVGCVDQGRIGRHRPHPLIEPASSRSVDDDKVESGVLLGDDAVERFLEPRTWIVRNHDRRDRRRRGSRFTRHVGAHVGDWDVGHGVRRLPPDSVADVALHTAQRRSPQRCQRWLPAPCPEPRVRSDVSRPLPVLDLTVRALITGANGFVGTHLVTCLTAAGDDVVENATDITDRNALIAAFTEAAPDVVYHLAAQADVGASWSTPVETLRVNVEGTLNVLDAARLAGATRVAAVTSADIYGPVSEVDLPLTEQQPLRPASPYAASKAAADMLCVQAGLGHGLDVVRIRAFNHLGPGQSDMFVASALASRIARAEHTGDTTIRVGNLEARRDFTDVRDVVRAYRALMGRGRPGEAYHVCSGTDRSVRELADILISLSSADITLETDPDLMRPVDLKVLQGDNTKISTDQTGPQHPDRADRGPPRVLARRGSFVSKRALITGITGQDGSYLAELLLEKDYEVLGMVRRSSTVNFERIAHLQDKITFVPGDLLDEISMIHILQNTVRRRSTTWPLSRSSRRRSASPSSPARPPPASSPPRRNPPRRPRDPLLPGEFFGDVRQGPRGPPNGTARSTARRMGPPRSTDTGSPSLSRATAFTQPAASSSTMRVPPQPGVRHPQDQPHRCPDRSAWSTNCDSATLMRSATGASPATMSRPCG